MILNRKRLLLCGASMGLVLAASNAALSHEAGKERARIVLSKELPAFDGSRLKATLVEVNYGPGEVSAPHSHPCAVLGYVIKGAVRTRVEGEPEMTLKAGQSFYEEPNKVHLVAGNASTTEPASFVAYLLCDREAPLTVDGSPSDNQGDSK